MTIKEFKVQLALGSLTYDMKYDLAANLNTPKEVLIILSTDKDWAIRCRVADNPNAPIEALTILSKDKDKDVKTSALRTLKYK